MSDVIEMKTTSTEEIAYRLYRDVLEAENFEFQEMEPDKAREYLLDAFADCLKAARGFRSS